MQSLDPTFTPSILIEKVKMTEYIHRFGLPYNESLICAFKCSCKQSISKLGKLYVFHRYICFWPQVLKFNADVWKFEDISGIKAKGKSLRILFVKSNNSNVKISGIENSEKFIQVVTQHWNNYCTLTNRVLMTSESETEKSEDSSDISTDSIVNGTPSEIAQSGFSSSPTPFINSSINNLTPQILSSPAPKKVSYEGFLTATEFQPGGETDFDCSVKEFYEKFVRNEAKEKFKEILAEKELTNINVSDWEVSEQFGFTRTQDFIVPLKGIPIGPSSAHAIVNEIYYFEGDNLIICSTNQTPDVPYGDSFKLEFKTTISPKGEKQCHFVEEFAVVFLKKVMLKGTIESQGINNAKKDIDVMIKKYTEKISGKPASSGDIEFIDDEVPEPKFFKQPKMKTIIETTIPMTPLQFFNTFVENKTREQQIKLREELGQTNIEMTNWKNIQGGFTRNINTIEPVDTPNGKVTTRAQIQEFYQLKKSALIIGSIKNYLDSQDYYSTETRLLLSLSKHNETILTVQANILLKKKGDEKEKDLMLKYEKECRHLIQTYIDKFEHEQRIKDTNRGIVSKVSDRVVELTFKEKMMAIQNILLLLIFLVLFGIFLKK
ncbi:hypothetical protein EDI_342040 [Entamoeba dispar SAW760]|uniref:VASt domain-containing protein n=1 Tax=Entamoeba dispar (strain ATCC PRA-260 / SAW760) TaxID=370354 RepID=B0E9N6_ENTDS|nr:uncharacterized protein EDI_342040 [Entamoeba dispar SAW760]EDR28754.1 hypothetical protein EDI_342040 [Entamoeba dispar SAW760]|eukprot:EDR28754.1 hypothetical protein EDI_342040 [Entamoeba dispar SAW760]